MKRFLSEFKTFIARGNVMDLAVGVIIGGAFSNITTSLVNDILNPILGILAGDNEALAALAVQLPGGGALMIGNFINAVIQFLIIALVVFLIVKALSRARMLTRRGKHIEEQDAPKCPFCLEEVNEGATRCPHCTAELPAPATTTPKAGGKA